MIKRNLHICPDDKFYKSFVVNQRRFAPDTENQYFVVTKTNTTQNQKKDNVFFLSYKDIINRLKEKSGQSDQVIFHSLPTLFRKKFLPVIPGNVAVTWLFYGYEYYHRRAMIREYLGPTTRDYYDSFRNPNYISLMLNRLKDRIRQEPQKYARDLHRINRFAHWNLEEYNLIKEQFGFTKMEYVPFSMGLMVHNIVPDLRHRYLLLGHSGAITVNHLDGIEAMGQDLIDSFDRILIPLSYGANKRYKDVVQKAAYDKMGEKALVLDRYMERSGYFNLLSRVKAAWMPQLRGMGGGNILFCMQNGIPVFVPKNSVMYRFYSRQGFKIWTIEENNPQNMEMTKAEKRINRENVQTFFGEQKIATQYKTLLIH